MIKNTLLFLCIRIMIFILLFPLAVPAEHSEPESQNSETVQSGTEAIKLKLIRQNTASDSNIFSVSGPGAESFTFTGNPAKIYTPPGRKYTLLISGGLPEYRWYCTAGDIEKVDAKHFIYTAPGRFGKDLISFEDRAGQTAAIDVDVLRPFAASPSTVQLKIGSTADVRLIGGSGDWVIVAKNGLEVIARTASNINIKIKSGSIEGLRKVILKDLITEEVVEIKINVYGKMTIQIDE